MEQSRYGAKALDHYENPRNVGSLDRNDPHVGTGMVGTPASEYVMKLQIFVTDEGVISEAKFRTYGCVGAIASSSLLTELIHGVSLEDAENIRNAQIVAELELPQDKIHCSVLAEEVVHAAIEDYRRKQVLKKTA